MDQVNAGAKIPCGKVPLKPPVLASKVQTEEPKNVEKIVELLRKNGCTLTCIKRVLFLNTLPDLFFL